MRAVGQGGNTAQTHVSVRQPEAARATRITLSPDMTTCFHPESSAH